MTGPVTTDFAQVRTEQRRVLRVLVAAQLLSGAGLAAGITVGALLAQQMLGATSMAGLPSALYTLGSAVAAVAVGRVSHRGGRRVGLATGYAAGALGAVGVVLAAVLDSAVLLFAALLVYGAGTATNLQARYAGADLAQPHRRGRAVSTVLVATTLGGVVGPTLTGASGAAVTPWGIPALAGPFLLAALAYGAAALVIGTRLRPDPLLRARELAAELTDGHTTMPTAGSRRAVVSGAAVMTLTQLVMVAIMTMTPVHMAAHGHGTTTAGVVIGIHVAAMYLPSPLSGWLVDRLGRTAVAVASGVVLLAAGILAATAPTDSVVLLALALALLGLGWNLGLVSGTAALAAGLPPDRRARTQGTVDVAIALSGASGGLLSGLTVATAGYPTLTLAGGLLALLVVPAVLIGHRRTPTRSVG